MGPNDETYANYLDYLMVDGEPVLFEGFCDHMETKLQPVVDDPDDCLTLRHQAPIEIEIKLAKRHRCKTRKRFVKLMMADGVSRNSANELTFCARCFYGSYQDAYLNHKLGVWSLT